MKISTDDLFEDAQRELSVVSSLKELELLKIKFCGKNGLIQDLIRSLPRIPLEERPLLGKQINSLKVKLDSIFDSSFDLLHRKELAERMDREKVDVTLPGRAFFSSRKHPIRAILDEALSLFFKLGFEVQYAPDIDSDWYNYEGLNFSADHPAREMQDTFYLDHGHLLRSHTSNAQLRAMEQASPPLKIVSPGKVYRNEDVSARSHLIFHQLEGFYIDRQLSFADLFTLMEWFWQQLFGKEISLRFRPSYFPFVEPGMELDISCLRCSGKGCDLCKKSGWLEVCGAGMIHPNVLANGGIDPNEYSGYAFGMGIERIAMLRYGITDVRLFLQNDMRFLAQF